MANTDLEMSEEIVYVKLDSYLAQWLVHEHGGTPVVFPKNSYENDVLEVSLSTKPKDTTCLKAGRLPCKKAYAKGL